MHAYLTSIANLLETILLLTALQITRNRSISHIITVYQMQSLLLAVVAALGTFQSVIIEGRNPEIIVLVIVLPLLLALFIRPLLARATIPVSLTELLRGRLYGQAYPERQLREDAEQEWLRPFNRNQVSGGYVLVFVSLLLLGLLIAGRIENANGFVSITKRLDLLSSLMLVLTGLYTMVIKQDIISQVIGLMVMDHGLYLAVIKIVPSPFPANIFVIGLYFYTLITVFILVILLPGVRSVSESIDLEDVQRQSLLKG